MATISKETMSTYHVVMPSHITPFKILLFIISYAPFSLFEKNLLNGPQTSPILSCPVASYLHRWAPSIGDPNHWSKLSPSWLKDYRKLPEPRYHNIQYLVFFHEPLLCVLLSLPSLGYLINGLGHRKEKFSTTLLICNRALSDWRWVIWGPNL